MASFFYVVQVSEVRLFEDGIEPDIFIAVCEWPADRSKILVYGHW